MRDLGVEVSAEDFAVRCDAPAVYWELVRSGCGIGVGQIAVGRRDPLLEQIMQDVPIPSLPVWLAAPEALRKSARIRRRWDLIGDALERVVS